MDIVKVVNPEAIVLNRVDATQFEIKYEGTVLVPAMNYFEAQKQLAMLQAEVRACGEVFMEVGKSEKRAVRSYVKRTGQVWLLRTSMVLVYADGTEEEAFEFYSDELSFHNGECNGMTVAEALSLKVKKDVAYLRD